MTPHRNASPSGRGFLVPAGIVVLALLAWAVTRSGLFSGNTKSASQVDTVAGPLPVPVAVANYLRYTQEQAARDASLSHTYTADGFRYLAAALETLANSPEFATGVREIRAKADSMQLDNKATTHARQAREAALIASTLISHARTSARPEFAVRVRELNDAAEAISAVRPLLDQSTSVQAFFGQSAQTLDALSK